MGGDHPHLGRDGELTASLYFDYANCDLRGKLNDINISKKQILMLTVECDLLCSPANTIRPEPQKASITR